MNRKAQGIEAIKTLVIMLVIAGIVMLLTFAIMDNINKSKSSNFCLVSINLAFEKKEADQLKCQRSSDVIKKSDFSDQAILDKKISTAITSCSAAVGGGTVNPFVVDYEQFSNCIVCSDLSFESNDSIRGVPFWMAKNFIPASKTETYYQRVTGEAPSQKIVDQLQSLQGIGVIDPSKKYSVFWKVDNKEYWTKLFESYSKKEVDLVKNDGSKTEFVVLGDSIDELFVAGEDFFGFVINVDDDKNFVSSIWIGTDDFMLSNFDQYGKCGAGVVKCGLAVSGDICYYVHN